MLKRFWRWLVPLEEINGNHRCPTYLYRWQLFKRFGYGLYVHRFVGSDWSLDFHDHPRKFISIGLWGRYAERTPHGLKQYRAPWVRSFPAEHKHRIELEPGRTAWTLVIVCRLTREWGFWHEGKWMHWKDYVRGKFSDLADAMKACH